MIGNKSYESKELISLRDCWIEYQELITYEEWWSYLTPILGSR